MLIYVIDDDRDFAEVIAGFAKGVKVKIFNNAIAAITEMDKEVPGLIFLDILLDGPDGFTLLHELRSYPDLAKIPVVIMSSLDFVGQDLSEYGVVACLNKSEMRPEQVKELVSKYA